MPISKYVKVAFVQTIPQGCGLGVKCLPWAHVFVTSWFENVAEEFLKSS